MCGYMGLDSMGSSLMETQKLSFEEQPDAKVKPVAPWGSGDPSHAGAGLSPAAPHTLGCHTLPILLRMSQLLLPNHNSPLPLPNHSHKCKDSENPNKMQESLLWRVQQSRQPKYPCLSLEPSFQVNSPVTIKICPAPSSLFPSPDEQHCCLSQNESLVLHLQINS